MRTPYGHEVYGMAAEYPSPHALFEAAKMVRDAGFKRWDVHSPFPIHGMDDAMGLGKSWLSAVVLIGGILGFSTAMFIEFGASWGLYPLIVHGKPFDWNLLSNVSHKKPVMLSGELTPENVADAIRIVRPDAVDVSSGVEDAPGVKNAAKIKAFVDNARAAAEKYLREKVS